MAIWGVLAIWGVTDSSIRAPTPETQIQLEFPIFDRMVLDWLSQFSSYSVTRFGVLAFSCFVPRRDVQHGTREQGGDVSSRIREPTEMVTAEVLREPSCVQERLISKVIDPSCYSDR